MSRKNSRRRTTTRLPVLSDKLVDFRLAAKHFNQKDLASNSKVSLRLIQNAESKNIAMATPAMLQKLAIYYKHRKLIDPTTSKVFTGDWQVWVNREPASGDVVDGNIQSTTMQSDVRSIQVLSDTELGEKTYYRYRTEQVPLIDSPKLIGHLESRYGCTAFQLGGRLIPASVIWSNDCDLIAPDSVLGVLNMDVPKPLQESPLLRPPEYGEARRFIKRQYESPSSPITDEGLNYRMTSIDLRGIPRMQGAFGWYYDNILTQYAIEWELKKALLHGGHRAIDGLVNVGTLPLREAIEARGNPLISGHCRCASITVSTLLVFNRRQHGFFCLIRRRSRHVGVSPGMLHVVPAGMFEAKNSLDNWAISINVWRELLEEVYSEKEQQNTGSAEFSDYMLQKQPIPLLEELLKDGSAEFSVTGLCCDLLNLRPEVCTVLFVRDHRYLEQRRMQLNWEYEPEGPAGTFAVPWGDIDQEIARLAETGGIVASGAVCLGLGRDWIRNRFQL